MTGTEQAVVSAGSPALWVGLLAGPGSIDDGTYEAPPTVDRNASATVELIVTDDDGTAGTVFDVITLFDQGVSG